MDVDNKRILIIKQSSLGDIVHTLPIAHALKRCYPTCSIGWVVAGAFAPIILRDTAVDEVYPIDIPSTSDPQADRLAYARAFKATMTTCKNLRRELKVKPYNVVLDLHASFRSGLLSLMNPGGTRVGFHDAKELNTLFQHKRIKNKEKKIHAIDINLLFLRYLNCEAGSDDFFITTDRNDEQGASSFLREQGIDGKDSFVYVNPSARWATKFWFVDRWGKLCDKLLSQGVKVVIGGSEGELPYINSITKCMELKAVVAAGQLSLTESIAVLKRAAVYVGLDTGPMHIAAMTKTPVVALFGPTHPERVAPYGVDNVILQAGDLDCLCCRKRTCEHRKCMQGISVEDVYDALSSLMGARDCTGRFTCA